jgi:hypothetical protein
VELCPVSDYFGSLLKIRGDTNDSLRRAWSRGSHQAAERLRTKSATIKTGDVRKARKDGRPPGFDHFGPGGSARGGVG